MLSGGFPHAFRDLVSFFLFGVHNKAAFPDEDAIDFGDLTRSVGFLLRMAQLQSFDMFFARLAKHGLKPGEFTLLWVVGLNPGLRQGSLARRLRIKPAHMTKLVQRLVAADLLARTDNRIEAIAYGAIIGGALGNVLDRIRFLGVTDLRSRQSRDCPPDWPFFQLLRRCYLPPSCSAVLSAALRQVFCLQPAGLPQNGCVVMS